MASKMLHCTMAEERAAYSLALAAWPSLFAGLSHADMHGFADALRW